MDKQIKEHRQNCSKYESVFDKKIMTKFKRKRKELRKVVTDKGLLIIQKGAKFSCRG
jgi:hypothetical protein